MAIETREIGNSNDRRHRTLAVERCEALRVRADEGDLLSNLSARVQRGSPSLYVERPTRCRGRCGRRVRSRISDTFRDDEKMEQPEMAKREKC